MSSKTEYLRKTNFREQAVQPQFSWWTSQKFEKCPVESNCLNAGVILKVDMTITLSRVFTALLKR